MSQSTKRGQARFSESEKEILHNLFQKYIDILDIKNRQNISSNIADLRKCWATIMKEFNTLSNTSHRTLKQLQKYWLNARVRNTIPGIIPSKRVSPKQPAKIKKEPPSIKNSYKLVKTSNHEDEGDEEDDTVMEVQLQEPKYAIQLKSSQGSVYEIIEESQQQDDDSHDNARDEQPNYQQDDSSPITTMIIPKLTSQPTMPSQLVEDAIAGRNGSGSANVAASLHLPHNERMKHLQAKEMEYKVDESYRRLELQLLEVEKRKEELVHLREMHKWSLREMQLRVRLLEEQVNNQ